MKNRNVGIVLSYLYTFLNMVIGLFLSSFLLRSLGDTEYGLYQTVSSFATYLVLLEFGTGTVMSRNIVVARNKGDEKKLKECISTVWVMNIVLAVVISIVALMFYINIGNIYHKTMSDVQIAYAQRIFILIVGYLICSFFLQTLDGLLLGMENYKFGQIVNIVRVLVRSATLVAFISLHKYAIIIAGVDFIISLIALIITYVYCKKKYKVSFGFSHFSREVFKQSLPLCSALIIQSLVNQANSSVDKFIIGIQVSMEAVAIYSVAQYIYSIFSAVTTIPISMYLPQVAKDIGNDYDGKRITNTICAPSRLISLIGGAILFGFFVCGQQFISIVYGENKIEAWGYAIIIMVPMLLNMITGPVINVLDVLNKRQFRSYVLLATTMLNIIMTVIFIKNWGIIGAVIATAIATTLGQITMMNIFYTKKLNIDIFRIYKYAMKGIIPFEIVGAIVGYSLGQIINNVYLSFIISGTVFVLISGGLIYFFGFSATERLKLKNKIIKNK